MFIENTKFWRQEKVKQELSKRILDGEYSLDWRHGCDSSESCVNKLNYTCFQVNLGDGILSEDSYCLNCLYKKVFEELFPNNMDDFKDNTEG